jgi:hypothetical protein
VIRKASRSWTPSSPAARRSSSWPGGVLVHVDHRHDVEVTDLEAAGVVRRQLDRAAHALASAFAQVGAGLFEQCIRDILVLGEDVAKEADSILVTVQGKLIDGRGDPPDIAAASRREPEAGLGVREEGVTLRIQASHEIHRQWRHEALGVETREAAREIHEAAALRGAADRMELKRSLAG